MSKISKDLGLLYDNEKDPFSVDNLIEGTFYYTESFIIWETIYLIDTKPTTRLENDAFLRRMDYMTQWILFNYLIWTDQLFRSRHF